MKSEELVSIITPTYNCGRFIAETIECVLAQTYQNWEMLIVDDCSTDNTEQVVRQYNDPRIKYHCLKQNSGAAVARNEALKMAKGRWIAFLDSDDLWTPNKLERQIEFMVANGYSFTYHEYDEIDEQGRKLGHLISGPKKVSHFGMVSYCWPGCLTVIYDANTIGLIQIPPIKKNNDYAMWLLVSQKAKCYLLKDVLASYRKRVGSISNHSYMSLIKWHYRLFKSITQHGTIMCSFLTLNNLICGVIKKIIYKSK